MNARLNKLAAVLCFALLPAAAFADQVQDQVMDVAHHWAGINYQSPDKDKEEAFKALAGQAAKLAEANPQRAEPKVWEAIVLASYAKANGGLGALSAVREARDLLLAAEKIDPDTLNGSVYTSLGSLYAKVPGWPVGFGDKDKAKEYLETALKKNPTGIDANYFYGDLMNDEEHYAKAVEYLNRALAAPARPGREDADAGRRKDIQTLLAKIRAEHADKVAAK